MISHHSSSSSRVIPASGPELSGGVTTVSPNTQKMFVPVPSHTFPAVLRKIASPAPRSAAQARARTFSAYEMDFTPASAPCSLRLHGAVTTAVVAGGWGDASAATISVGGPYAACDPSGPAPPV